MCVGRNGAPIAFLPLQTHQKIVSVQFSPISEFQRKLAGTFLYIIYFLTSKGLSLSLGKVPHRRTGVPVT